MKSESWVTCSSLRYPSEGLEARDDRLVWSGNPAWVRKVQQSRGLIQWHGIIHNFSKLV